ncbi:PE domain-containing protein [Saccharomonospora halophila]|uniref:PE domain-containing protein n=1 Tax=Saccharomonospora halophila TaxID=129922 RepID=UPI0006890F1C|nr:PE domain-containing protein [Saccharomonospora halophila]
MAEDTPTDAMADAAGMASALPGPIGAAGKAISIAAPFIQGEPKPPEGHFTFSPEELDKIIAEWEDLRSALDSDEQKAMHMTNIQPPGNDFASSDFSNSANPSGDGFLRAIEKMIDYVDKYIEALKDAREKIATQDEQANSEITKAGGVEV